MRTLNALKPTIFIALAFLTTEAGATDSHFVGTWAGDLDEHHQRELTVRGVSQGKTASGWYCIRGPGVHQVSDFHGDGSRHGAVKARATKRKLTTKIRGFKITGVMNRDRDAIQFTAKSKKRTVEYALHPRQPAEAPCRPRIVPLPVAGIPDDDRPAGQTFADVLGVAVPESHPFVGSWTGERDNGLVIELNVTSVADGLVRGLYCNISPSGWRATDMDRELRGAIDAKATDTELTFERKDRAFSFTLDDPENMTYVQTVPGKGSRTLAMVRTDDPACASRVIVQTK